MKTSPSAPVQHALSFDRETEEATGYDQWVIQVPNGYATTSCSCGVSTGPDPVGEAEARQLFEEHSRAVREDRSLGRT
jgi:hypothetical protein